MRQVCRLLLSTGIVFAAIHACGGKAVVDGAANSGGTNTGGVNAGGANTGGTTPPDVAVVNVGPGVGGGAASMCGEACASFDPCGAAPVDCEQRCDSIGGVCREAHQRWLSCSLGEVGTMCGIVPAQVCGPDLLSYLECSNVLVDESCVFGPGFACSCDGFISPGVSLSQTCDDGGNCLCFVGNTQVGVCREGEAACGIGSGCCAGLFFTAPVN